MILQQPLVDLVIIIVMIMKKLENFLQVNNAYNHLILHKKILKTVTG